MNAYSVVHFAAGLLAGFLTLYAPLAGLAIVLLFLLYQFVIDVYLLRDKRPRMEIVEFALGYAAGLGVYAVYACA